MEQTIFSALCAARKDAGLKPVLLGINRTPLKHNGLIAQIEQTVVNLNQAGLGRGDTVAIVLANGPDAASCCLAVAAGATAAPISAGSTAPQFKEHFAALGAKAVIVNEDGDPNAVRVAGEMGIPIIRLFADRNTPAGMFSLDLRGIGNKSAAQNPGFAAPADVALLMRTTGSTGRPKLAPLTHSNVCAGATNNARHLGLTATDRCLCVTGMFFTQGILVSVFSPLMMGGSTVCTPGFDPVNFFAWLDEFRPTWYAAPTALQRSILNRAPLHPDIVSRAQLRVIRCSSAPADSELIAQVESLFRAPLLDSYGMTEASSTMVGVPLPPGERKPGSVGISTGCEVRTVDESGAFLPPNEIGEIVVRGPSVIAAYEADASINQSSFFNEWLRTGDLGRIDNDGYVFLTGRIKELINRGGEKISPVEIDAAFHAHPAVAEAMTFAIPDKRLGEEIGVAVVLRGGQTPSRQLERQLREFAVSRLSIRQLPRSIVFVKEIPKSATGKSLRLGLAEKLGLTRSVQEEKDGRPVDAMERAERTRIPDGIVEMLLLQIWEDVLGRRPLGIHDDFFDFGGDSLLAVQLMIRIEDTFRKKLTIASLLEAPTVARMTSLLVESQSSGYNFGPSKIISVRTSGSLPPLFILGLQPLFHPMIRSLSDGIPVFGLSFPDTATLSLPFQMEEVASRQVEALRRFRPHGPYALAGWCNDGILAYEMAQQLQAQGEEVLFVAMIDAFNPEWRYERRWKAGLDALRFHCGMLAGMSFKDAVPYMADRWETLRHKLRREVGQMLYRTPLATERRVGDRLRVSDQILAIAAREYAPQTYDGSILLLRAEIRRRDRNGDIAFGWRGVAPNLRVIDIPGNHRDMFRAPNATVMASALNDAFDRALFENRPAAVFQMDPQPLQLR